MEFLIVKCLPFYLPKEFSSILVIAVYLPLNANANIALAEPSQAINELQTVHLEAEWGCLSASGLFRVHRLEHV